MKILIVGSGGREHALAWKLKQSPQVTALFVAPGNAGTAELATNIPLSNTDEIISWVKTNPVDLVVVGPDNFLAEGMVDELKKIDMPVFGPTKEAAKIEWSKAFAKEFMKKENIPTARFETFTDSKKAKDYVITQKFPVVIKASGLALGKGVIIAKEKIEADRAIQEILEDKIFGEAGNELIIEEYLEGIEISVHAFCDGKDAVMFPPAQDHKRAYENDLGPNTGGMGTIAPVPGISEAQMEEIKEKIVIPTLAALAERGTPFCGILFPGIMLTENGPKVIEFNARFGDPETQSYMRILESDLLPILLSCANGTVSTQKINWSKKYVSCVVAASAGYPGAYKKGEIISGLENKKDSNVVIFHAGTKREDKKTLTNGGRVLGTTATGDTLSESLEKNYSALKNISFPGMWFRKDIGKKAL